MSAWGECTHLRAHDEVAAVVGVAPEAGRGRRGVRGGRGVRVRQDVVRGAGRGRGACRWVAASSVAEQVELGGACTGRAIRAQPDPGRKGSARVRFPRVPRASARGAGAQPPGPWAVNPPVGPHVRVRVLARVVGDLVAARQRAVTRSIARERRARATGAALGGAPSREAICWVVGPRRAGENLGGAQGAELRVAAVTRNQLGANALCERRVVARLSHQSVPGGGWRLDLRPAGQRQRRWR